MNHDFVLTTTIGLLHSTLSEVNQKFFYFSFRRNTTKRRHELCGLRSACIVRGRICWRLCPVFRPKDL